MRKYSMLYSNKAKKKPGRKGPDQQLIDLVIKIRKLNPRMGYLRISMQIYDAFGIVISPLLSVESYENTSRIVIQEKVKGPRG